MIVLAAIIGYLMMMGATYTLSVPYQRRRCEYHTDATVLSGLSGLFWPAIVPVATGAAIAKGLRRATVSDGLSREERKRSKEIKDAQHRAELAVIQAQETEAINRQLEAAQR